MVDNTLIKHGGSQADWEDVSAPNPQKTPRSIRITTPTDSYVTVYPQAITFAEEQEGVFWPSTEVDVEKDLHDLKVNLTEAELHGVTTVLKLFTKYEVQIGEDYWLGYVMKNFPRPEIQRMASMFGMMELNTHATFYNKINEVLGLDTDEFYTAYIDDPVLNGRMEWIGKALKEAPDTDVGRYVTVAISSILEGAVLYSNFAFLKHFQAEGKNKLVNLVAGIDFSVRDENIHSLAGAWLAKTISDEAGLSGSERVEADLLIAEATVQIRSHEYQIIDMIFEKGSIRGITAEQMKHFIDSRLDLCLEQLGIPSLYNPTYNPIKSWFYRDIQLSSFNDIFQKQGNEYNRNWREGAFTW